ncbi:MAG: DUF6361 family protein [Lachnospiraceae bacterium]|nr:DUF6361 family protein [Lachnospiraceae bacterium]
MPLGWIDFSKKERNKVLSVLDLLSEAGTLDELGIAPIRDGYANIFFPGTSTIQTRAKYFLIVPYALKDMEFNNETNPNRILKDFDEVEKKCGKRFLANNSNTDGIIGSRSLGQGKWVKRTPADIYWAGLRNYGIFTGGTLSLSEYIRAICALKNQKATLAKLGNRNDAEEDDGDDKDAGELLRMQFWHIPTYNPDWEETLNIKLSEDEGRFLKRQIIMSYPDSMMAYILKNNITEILEARNFASLEGLIHLFPKEIQTDYIMAKKFSNFLYVLRTIYNIIVSDGENIDANSEWDTLKPSLDRLADLNLEELFKRLQLFGNVFLCNFLRKEKTLMMDNNLEEMKNEIRRRERELKQNRAKTMHPGEFDPNIWYGGGELDYRFNNAKVIMKDIFESEGLYAKSK